MNKFYFGFDTSNYTTSFAVCGNDGRILLNSKKMLEVRKGERGLRQSDAVFQHTVNAEFVSEQIKSFLNDNEGEVAAIGCSVRPRDIDGSYMPCFLVGRGVAENVASSLKVPFYQFSHQAGHIAAALCGSGAQRLIGEEFASFHVSGGTTDILRVTSYSNGIFDLERVGGTKDLNAGQIIDRVGVKMGLPFPAGRYMEELASSFSGRLPRYPRATDGLSCNLSGIENKAYELFEKTGDSEMTAAFTLRAISDTVAYLTEAIYETYGEIPIVYAGGVMSCKLIKERLQDDERYFAPPEYSSDNACGAAYLAYLQSSRTIGG